MIKIINSECLEYLKTLPDNSIDSIITDPPYGLSFMNKKWDYDIPKIEVWKECLRVAKPGCIILCFGGSRTFHRIAISIEDAGWEIRDTIMWLYGSGFPKSYDISKGIDKKLGAERERVGGCDSGGFANVMKNNEEQGYRPDNYYEDGNNHISNDAITEEAKLWNGWKTALKPAFEPIIVAMKPVEESFANNALMHGVAGLNIAECGIPTMQSENLGRDNSKCDKDEFLKGKKRIDQSKPNGTDRYPANIILDEEAAQMLDEQTGILNSGKSNGGAIIGESSNGVIKEMRRGKLISRNDHGGASRFFYCAKASKSERNNGLENEETKETHRYGAGIGATHEKPCIEKNNHPTVKPLALMEYLCKLTKTPTGGIVLDPFMGSGTTMIACVNAGRDGLGIELNAEYVNIAEKRIQEAERLISEKQKQTSLF